MFGGNMMFLSKYTAAGGQFFNIGQDWVQYYSTPTVEYFTTKTRAVRSKDSSILTHLWVKAFYPW
jgi:hypothetical protein